MEEKNTKLTFELTDLSYKELTDTYKEIIDFTNYLDKLITDIEADEEGGKSE